MDFSKPVDSSKDSIDISTDRITTPIRLPDSVPRLEGGVLWISDGVMHMLPGMYAPVHYTANEDGNMINITFPILTNNVWTFDLKSQKWDVQVSGVEDGPTYPAITFDTKTQVGWYYGGRYGDIGLHDLYRLDRGEATPKIEETNSSLVGTVVYGALVYIEGAGEAGILVLLGGDAESSTTSDQMVSMANQVGKPFLVPFWLIYLCRDH